MTKRKSFVGCPMLITHWDPDLYPREPLPLVPELVIHILAHGEVWLKEVDLFLNPTISANLADPAVFEQFSSLVATKRLKVLIPDKSRDLDDPIKHPILSTAMEIVRSRRPLKSHPWKMTEKDKHLCDALDSMLVANGGLKSTGVVRQRVKPPADRNVFASTLIKVLNGQDRRWRQRDQFKGIDPRIADQFTGFAKNHELAIDLLRKKGITPNATNGFYRSLLYQCADYLLPEEQKRQRRAMKNLGQSVYAHCELDRENAAGTYYGSRVAELPPTDKDLSPDEPLLRVDVVPQRVAAKIPVAANIGEIVAKVLEECDESMRTFWAIAGEVPLPQQEFGLAWEHVADAFGKYSAGARRAGSSSTGNALWTATEYIIHTAEMFTEVGERSGVKWIPDFREYPKATAVWLGMKAIATYGRPTMEYIRRGRADAQKGKIKQVLLNAATARCGRVK